MRLRHVAAVCGTATTVLVLSALPGQAATGAAGHTVGVVRGAHVGLNMTQSNNWSGYDQGMLDTGSGFHAITGQWVVPTATPAKAGQDESSSSWIGIGGGCLESSCLLTDSTLIQAGTEQDVAADGSTAYNAWYELIPAPSITTPLVVHPGDTVSVSIAESLPELWTIQMKNVTTGGTWSTTVPYTSTYGSAEWIEETPITIGGSGAGLAAMPKLGTVTFDAATVNGAPANLAASQAMQLVDGNGQVLATPSAPDAERDGFNDCTYATTCAAP